MWLRAIAVTIRGLTDESEILKFLQHGTLVGLLPVPHPILIRKYQANSGTTMWFRTYMWGVIYLRLAIQLCSCLLCVTCSLSFCPSVCPSVPLSVLLSLCLSVCSSVDQSVSVCYERELQTVELIKMLFSMWTRGSPRNHVIDKGPDRPPRRGSFGGGE